MSSIVSSASNPHELSSYLKEPGQSLQKGRREPPVSRRVRYPDRDKDSQEIRQRKIKELSELQFRARKGPVQIRKNPETDNLEAAAQNIARQKDAATAIRTSSLAERFWDIRRQQSAAAESKRVAPQEQHSPDTLITDSSFEKLSPQLESRQVKSAQPTEQSKGKREQASIAHKNAGRKQRPSTQALNRRSFFGHMTEQNERSRSSSIEGADKSASTQNDAQQREAVSSFKLDLSRDKEMRKVIEEGSIDLFEFLLAAGLSCSPTIIKTAEKIYPHKELPIYLRKCVSNVFHESSSSIILEGKLERIRRLLEHRQASTEMLHCALLRNDEESVKIVEMLLGKNAEPSRSVVYLALFMRNMVSGERRSHIDKILGKIYESPLFSEETKICFEKEAFQQSLKYLSMCLLDSDCLDLSGHPEVADEFFFFKTAFFLPSIRKINLSGCVGIKDAGLKWIAEIFPDLEEISLDVETHYEDLEILALEEKGAPFPWDENYRIKLEYKNYQKRQRDLTLEGVRILGECLPKLERLSLRYCHSLKDEIADLFIDPRYFPRLRFLDLSECYKITEEAIGRIQEGSQTEVCYEGIFPSPALPQILRYAQEKRRGKVSSKTAFRLLQAVTIKDRNQRIWRCLNILLEDERVSTGFTAQEWNEKNQPSFAAEEFPFSTIGHRKPLGDPIQKSDPEKLTEDLQCDASLEDLKKILHSSVTNKDFLVLYELLKRGVTFDEDTLNVALESGVNSQALRMILAHRIMPTNQMLQSAILKRKKNGENQKDADITDEILCLLIKHTYAPSEETLDLAVKCLYNNLLCMKELLARKVKPTHNTLLLAVEYNHLRIIKLLLQYPVALTEDILNIAVVHNTLAALSLLLEKEIVPSRETLELAKARGDGQILKLIQDKMSSFSKPPQSIAPNVRPDIEKLILHGSLADVEKQLGEMIDVEEELINLSIERGFHPLLKILLNKTNRQLTGRPYALACLRGFDSAIELLRQKTQCIPDEMQIKGYLTDSVFKSLVRFWKNRETLDFKECVNLTDGCFEHLYKSAQSLPNVKKLNLINCSGLTNKTLSRIPFIFPHLETLAVSLYKEEALVQKDLRENRSASQSFNYIKKCRNLKELFIMNWPEVPEEVLDCLNQSLDLCELTDLTFFHCGAIPKEKLLPVQKVRPSLKIMVIPSLRVKAKEEISANFTESEPFGKQEWETYFGEVGQVPPLPANIKEILSSPCPIWGESSRKKVEETHLLVLIPKTVNGNPLTLNYLGELIKQPREMGYKTSYRYYDEDVRQLYGEAKVLDDSYWVLLTKDILPGTRGEEPDSIPLGNYKGIGEWAYQMPKVREVAICILMHHVRTGVRLYNSSPWTSTYCEETMPSPRGGRLLIGNFAPPGLGIHYSEQSSSRSGWAAVLRLPKK